MHQLGPNFKMYPEGKRSKKQSATIATCRRSPIRLFLQEDNRANLE